MLISRFSKCAVKVKCVLFRTYCLCMYSLGLWKQYSITPLNKFKSRYHKCIKKCFRYARLDSITSIFVSPEVANLWNCNKQCHCYSPLAAIADEQWCYTVLKSASFIVFFIVSYYVLCVCVWVCVLYFYVSHALFNGPLWSELQQHNDDGDDYLYYDCMYAACILSVFWSFFPNGWQFLIKILQAYCMFGATANYYILFNYI